MYHFDLHLKLFVLAALLLAGACAGPRANVRVLGVQQAAAPEAGEADEVLVVFLQVENPTTRDLELARLEYRLSADPVFATDGAVAINRSVRARGSTVIEIAVRLSKGDLERASEASLPYALAGTLVADAGAGTESRWRIEARGALSAKRERNGVRVVLAPASYE